VARIGPKERSEVSSVHDGKAHVGASAVYHDNARVVSMSTRARVIVRLVGDG
jgi:hypothetical protein